LFSAIKFIPDFMSISTRSSNAHYNRTNLSIKNVFELNSVTVFPSRPSWIKCIFFNCVYCTWSWYSYRSLGDILDESRDLGNLWLTLDIFILAT